MNRKRIWVIAVILAAAAGLFALQKVNSPTEKTTPPSHGTPEISVPPSFTATYEGCSFIWATYDSPELTAKLDEAVRAIDPQAGANVSLFGENCVYADGRSTFSTMETDFYVRRPVENFTDVEGLGNWMKLVMDLISRIPQEEIPGNPGFVEFLFIKGETENGVARVPLLDYRNESAGRGGAELFEMYFKPPSIPITPHLT